MKLSLCIPAALTMIAPANLQAQSISWPSDAATVGSGYDSLRGITRGRCVIADKKGPEPVAGEGIKYVFTSIEDEYDLTSHLGMSASAKYGVFSGEAKASEDIHINRFSSYLFISLKDEVRTVSINRFDMTEPSIKGPDAGHLPHSVATFISRCGDYFVATQSVGGEFTAVVEIQTSSEADRRSVNASISSSGTLTTSAQVDSSIDAVTSHHSTRVFIIRDGGTGVLNTDVKGLKTAVSEFPALIANTPSEKLKPFRATLLDYASLVTPTGTTRQSFNVDNNRLFLEDADEFVANTNLSVSNVRYAIAHSQEFPPFDQKPLVTFLSSASPALRTVKIEIRKCLDVDVDCGKFIAPQLPTLSIPERPVGPSRDDLLATIANQKTIWDDEASDDATFHRANEWCSGNQMIYCIGALRAFSKRLEQRGIIH